LYSYLGKRPHGIPTSPHGHQIIVIIALEAIKCLRSNTLKGVKILMLGGIEHTSNRVKKSWNTPPKELKLW
jgi:hypothetical protein